MPNETIPADDSNKAATQDHMARKRTTKETHRTRHSAYFPTPLNVQTIEPLKAMFKQVVADINATTGLTMLDQGGVTQQTLCSLAILWMRRTMDDKAKGTKHLIRELGPHMDELSAMVMDDLLPRGREVDPSFLPPGYDLTAKKAKLRRQQAREQEGNNGD